MDFSLFHQLGESPIQVWPDWDGGSIAGLAGSAWEALTGQPATRAPAPTGYPDGGGMQTAIRSDLLEPSRADVVVLVVVDALGYFQLLGQLGVGAMPHLERLLAHGGRLRDLTSVFPSTTAAALTTLATGVAPDRHGFVGFTVWLPDRGTVWNMLEMRPVTASEGDPGTLPDGVGDAVPTLFERLALIEVPSVAFGPRPLLGTAFSRVLYRGARLEPYDRLDELTERMEAAAQAARRAGRAALVSAYYPTIDAVAHRAGTESAIYAGEVARLDAGLFQWFGRLDLGGRGLVLVVADHGQIDGREAGRVLLNDAPGLAERLARPPAGERRAVYLTVEPSRRDEAIPFIQSEFRLQAEWLDLGEAWARGLFGPDSERDPKRPNAFRDRTGDGILLPRGGFQLHWAHRDQDRADFSVGLHGGLTGEEMRVPLLAWRC